MFVLLWRGGQTLCRVTFASDDRQCWISREPRISKGELTARERRAFGGSDRARVLTRRTEADALDARHRHHNLRTTATKRGSLPVKTRSTFHPVPSRIADISAGDTSR